jgi:hypothetical protein
VGVMTEENFEKFLKKEAQGYNAPPARTPRDEMWSAIQAQRAAGPRVVYGGAGTHGTGRPMVLGTRVWLGAAAAGLLLIATGVGIGRWSANGPTSPIARSTNSPASATPLIASGAQTQKGGVAESQIATPSTEAGSRDLPGSNQTPRSSGGAAERVASSVGRSNPGTTSGTATDNSTSVEAAPGSGTSAYQLTAMQHLSEAEALLTSFRARSAADQQTDAQLSAWARQLLSNTRLLLDSPVANDPQRRPLLEDLELVLVQIVQLSPGSTPQDRDLIEKTLQQDHVMTRLRTAIPAGSQRGS